MVENKIKTAAEWLKRLIDEYGSVEWAWAAEAAGNATGATQEQVYYAYWSGYESGWFVRKRLKGDIGVSLCPGSGVPVTVDIGTSYSL